MLKSLNVPALPCSVAAYAAHFLGIGATPQVRLRRPWVYEETGELFARSSIFNVDLDGTLWLLDAEGQPGLKPAIRLKPTDILDHALWDVHVDRKRREKHS